MVLLGARVSRPAQTHERVWRPALPAPSYTSSPASRLEARPSNGSATSAAVTIAPILQITGCSREVVSFLIRDGTASNGQ